MYSEGTFLSRSHTLPMVFGKLRATQDQSKSLGTRTLDSNAIGRFLGFVPSGCLAPAMQVHDSKCRMYRAVKKHPPSPELF